MRRRFPLALAFLASAASPALSQGWIEGPTPSTSPRPVPIGGPVIRVQSDVRVTLDGRVARIEVEERFQNAGSTIAEGTYLYPLPGEAVFSGFSLWMGDQELQGEMQNAEQARAIYEEIVRRQRDPALLTYAGHGLIRAQIFPIQPGETRKVVLKYTQVLGREGDALRMRYAIGPRGSTRAQGGEGGFSDNFSLRVTAADSGFGTPYSPTHDVTTTRRGGRMVVSIPATASGDFDLLIPLRRGLVGTSILTHASAGEDGYYMLLLAPPESPTAAAIPRNLTLVVDVSGSMSGAKLDQAKAALTQALGSLGAQDQFRLITFSSAVTEFRTGLIPATRANIATAQEFVNGLSAAGGTNIEGALDVALRQSAPAEGRLSLVVFMTDGLPSVGQTQPDQIAEAAGSRIGNARIFTVGVGTDVNTFLLDRLAKEGRGSATYVAPNADVEVAVGVLLGRIRHPALTDLRIVSAPVSLREMQPAQLPDLFYGEELVVFGRYQGTGSGDVVIEGRRNGRRERFTARAQFASREPDNTFVPPLWASRRIGELTRTARLEGATPALIEEIRQLGLRYGLLTEYTSFLVLEPGATPAAPEPSLRGGRDAAKSMSGQAAFARAEASAREAEVKSLAAADAVANRRLADAPSAPGERQAEARRRSGRVFVDRDGVWTDMTYAPGSPTIVVAPYSTAYFELVRALPELNGWLGVGEQVVVAGQRVSIRIAPDGRSAWRGGQLTTLVSDFRGR